MDDFDAIMNEAFGDSELAKPAPTQTRDNGLHYLADQDNVSVYEVVFDNRTVLHVLVDNATQVSMPKELKGHVHPQATAHPIVVANLDHSVQLPTSGIAIMGKHHLNSDTVRTYVLPRLVRFLVRVYSIGA